MLLNCLRTAGAADPDEYLMWAQEDPMAQMATITSEQEHACMPYPMHAHLSIP